MKLAGGHPLRVDVQRANTSSKVPSDAEIENWCQLVLKKRNGALELLIRIVDEPESAQLNKTYRNKKGPTNILSFPFQAPDGLEWPLLGDLVVCAPVIDREAAEQGKSSKAHWAHMIVHGILHLQGYDHLTASEASEMEALEVRLLGQLGYADPYE